MKIGIIGAGFVGRAVARLATQAGHQVMLSNSRGPQTLFSLKPMIGCEAGTVEEAADFSDMVVIAVPLNAVAQLPSSRLKNKLIIDAVNYYPERDGQIAELDNGTLTTSERLAQQFPDATVVKAFNAIQMTDLEVQGLPAGDSNRRALPLAGDDEQAKKRVATLYDTFGFDPVDVGPLAEGWRFERGTPVYCVRMTRAQLKAAVAGTSRR